MKRGTPEHPKVKRLARLLKINRAWAIGLLEALWHWAGRFAPQGDIGRHEDAEIAEGVFWEKNPRVLIEALLTAGWLEVHATHRLIIHDWHDHADDAVRKYLKRNNLEFQTVSRHSPDNVETVSRQKSPAIASASASASTSASATASDGQNGGGGGGGTTDWSRAKATANRICRTLGLSAPKEGKYRRLIIQAAALADRDDLGQRWLDEAIEDTRLAKPTKPWQYWAACLRTGAENHGFKLDSILATMKVPDEFNQKAETPEPPAKGKS